MPDPAPTLAASSRRRPCPRATFRACAAAAHAATSPTGWPVPTAATRRRRWCWPPRPRPTAATRSRRTTRGSSIRACRDPPGSDRSDRPLFRPHRRRVHHHPRSIDQPRTTQLVQHNPLHPRPQPRLRPLGEPAMRGGNRDTKRRRPAPPRTATGQHEHNRGEHRPVIHRRRPTALPTRRELRDQRRDQHP